MLTSASCAKSTFNFFFSKSTGNSAVFKTLSKITLQSSFSYSGKTSISGNSGADGLILVAIKKVCDAIPPTCCLKKSLTCIIASLY